MTHALRFALLYLVAIFGDNLIQGNNETKLLIDNDAGGEDAMAIFLALLYEKFYNGPKVIALTTVNGKTNEDNVCTNNQRIRKVAKREDVPIYRGSKTSLVITPLAGAYYGIDGLGDNGGAISGMVAPQKESAVEALLGLSKEYEGHLIVAALGTLTNVALAMALDPGFLGRLQHLYVGAGNIHDNNKNSEFAEFNARMDVEAYRIVVKNASPEKVTILPFSQVTTSLNVSRTWRLDTLGGIKSNIMRAQNTFERVSLDKGTHWTALDPAVIAAAVKPDLVKEYRYSKNDIILCGDNRGRNTNTFVDKVDANVRVIHSMKDAEYKRFLVDIFSGGSQSKNSTKHN